MRRNTARLVAVGVFLGTASFACQPRAPSTTPETGPQTDASAPVPQEAPLTADEQTLLVGLREHADRLTAMGERNEEHIWELAEAADYVALSLEAMGYPVQRQGYETPHVAAQNLIVSLPGGERGDQVLVVAAHYDSRLGTVGSAPAVATAALLELARMMRGAELKRSLRLAFLSMGEPPHARGNACGAGHYAERLSSEANQSPKPGLPPAVANAGIIAPIGVVVLGDLRALSAAPPVAGVQNGGSETWLSSSSLPLAANASAFRLEQLFAEGFEDELVTFERRSFSPRDCDALAFDSHGLSVVALGGLPTIQKVGTRPTTALPVAVDRSASPLPAGAELQWRRTARVVMRIRAGIGRVLGEKPTNDGMVTLGVPKGG